VTGGKSTASGKYQNVYRIADEKQWFERLFTQENVRREQIPELGHLKNPCGFDMLCVAMLSSSLQRIVSSLEQRQMKLLDSVPTEPRSLLEPLDVLFLFSCGLLHSF
jgi:hypothetical protein